jgi:hypothetical protein
MAEDLRPEREHQVPLAANQCSGARLPVRQPSSGEEDAFDEFGHDRHAAGSRPLSAPSLSSTAPVKPAIRLLPYLHRPFLIQMEETGKELERTTRPTGRDLMHD